VVDGKQVGFNDGSNNAMKIVAMMPEFEKL